MGGWVGLGIGKGFEAKGICMAHLKRIISLGGVECEWEPGRAEGCVSVRGQGVSRAGAHSNEMGRVLCFCVHGGQPMMA